jgi:hypothetical protein
MAADVAPTYQPSPSLLMSPAAWLKLLEGKLDEQARAVRDPELYYNGEHRLAFATAKFREAFSRFFPPMANNWMKLVVEAPVARLEIQGFRFNTDPNRPSWDQAADRDAWNIWQANNLDSGADIAHREMVKLGVVNLLVTPNGIEEGIPLVTVEHPAQSYVLCDRANRLKRLAAIKRWVDTDGYAYATIYLPDVLHKFRSTEKVRGSQRYVAGGEIQWVRRQDDPVENNPIGVVPMIPLENMPDLMWGGRSALEVAMPIQDAVNKYCLDMQVSSEFHAFPQRWASGWEKATDPAGNPVDPSIAMGNTRIVTSKSENTKFGEFAQGNVENYIKPIEMFLEQLASMTQTPAYYIKGTMANMSAEAILAADAGLEDRCRLTIRGASDGWEEMMRVCFLSKGDTLRGKARSAEVIWGNVRHVSLPQIADAVVKIRAGLSVPLEFCWEELGWSPQKIAMAKKMMNLPDSPADAAMRLDQSVIPGMGQMPGIGGQLAQNQNLGGVPAQALRQRQSGVIVPRA